MEKSEAKVAIVVDASIALAWYFPDEKREFADQLAQSLPDLEVIVPALWAYEVANALIVAERRGRITREKNEEWLSFLGALPITIDGATAQIWTSVMEIAREHQLSVYDAAYIELSVRRKIGLATLDEKLRNAAEKCGVSTGLPV